MAIISDVAPFEEYMLVDDRPAFPMCFFVRLRFSGQLQRAPFQQSLQIAVDRHPLLSAVVIDQRRGGLAWSTATAPRADIEWMSSVDDLCGQTERLDLRAVAGLRVQVAAETDTTHVILRLHHACCDAAGAYQFVTDLLIAYARAVGNSDVGFPDLDPAILAVRDKYGMTPWRWIKAAPKQMRGLLGIRRFLMHQPVPLSLAEPSLVDERPGGGYPAFRTHTFSVTATQAIVAAAKRQSVTINDLLARDLFLALNDFRQSAGASDDREWVRLNVPMNLRGQHDMQCSAANILSMVFLDRCPMECKDPQTLLMSIHRQMNVIKSNRLGFTFLWSLRAARALPGGLSRAARKVKCEATAVLSNIGQPLKDCTLPRSDGNIVAGDVVLEQTDFLPPYRPYTSVAFSITTYARRLTITMHYDPLSLDAPQADQLQSDYVRRVTASLTAADDSEVA